MKRILYFDCYMGISGDMTLGALIDLGTDPEALKRELQKLEIGQYSLQVGKVTKYGFRGTDIDVILGNTCRDSSHEQECGHHHHGQECGGHSHEGGNDSGHHHHHHGHRSLKEIREMIQRSGISDRAKQLSLAMFEAVGQAEAKAHGMVLDEVHFHEVGAVDSLVDTVGAAICMDLLGVDEVRCSVVRDGTGFVTCEHGILPVPVPAVANMLPGSGIRLVQTDEIETEMVTPTGFGILKGSGAVCGPMPEMEVLGVGLGFGKKDFGRLNGLRAFLGQMAEYGERCADTESNRDGGTGPDPDGAASDGRERDRIAVLESNLDDETGEVIGYTLGLLRKAGALDAYTAPIQMKKDRPGAVLSVLCRPEDREKLAEIILRETSALGVRMTEAERMILPRRSVIVDTPYGPASAKLARCGGREKVSPEYEDCARIAAKENIPLSLVYEAVRKAQKEQRDAELLSEIRAGGVGKQTRNDGTE